MPAFATELLLAVAVTVSQAPQADGIRDSVGLDRLRPIDRERQLLVKLDSGEVHIEVTSRAASVTVVAPSGTFLVTYDTDEPLAQWAHGARALQPPRAMPDPDSAAVGAGAGTSYSVVRLIDRPYPTVFRLVRLTADSLPAYRLDGTNGAWGFALNVSAAQANILFAALRGDTTSGAIPYEFPRTGKTKKESTPAVDGSYLGHQVDRSVRRRERLRRRLDPPDALQPGVVDTVLLVFIVEANGRVRPSSVRLIGTANPVLAVAARDDLLRTRFHPAKLDGKSVPQYVMQPFVFSGR
jgi:hypothetical protein